MLTIRRAQRSRPTSGRIVLRSGLRSSRSTSNVFLPMSHRPPAPSLTDYAAVADYLFGLKARGVKFGIDRMRGFAAALGNPERVVPCVHVAGTNGKGSVAAMLDAILHAAGWRSGLYTSPHLVKLGER